MASQSRERLLASTALTATNTGAAVNINSRAKNLMGHLAVTAANAMTTVNCKIQHSPDKTNWYDYVTFTAIVGTTGAEVKIPTNDRILPFVRSVVTLSGGVQTCTAEVDLWFEAF